MQPPTNVDVPKQSAQPPPKKLPWYRRGIRLSGQLLLLGLALGGLTLLWLLVRPSSQPPTSAAQVATATSSPTATARPTVVPSPTAQTVTVGGYTFGLPKLVTETVQVINLAQWIEGSDYELLALGASNGEFTVNIFDTRQGSLKRIAGSPNGIVGRPVWLPDSQQVAYLVYDDTGSYLSLYLSPNSSRASSRLVQKQVARPIAPIGKGQDILVLDETRQSLQTTNGTTRQIINSFSVDELFPYSSIGPFPEYQAAWTKQHDWIAYYNPEQFLLVNPKTGEAQDVSLGTIDIGTVPVELQASCGQWSPDGQTLALIVGARDGQPGYFTQFALFDLATLETQLIEIAATHITDLAWSPDSRQVLVQARIGQVDGFGLIEWFLVEVETQQAKPIPILPDPATLVSFCNGLAWSPDDGFVFGTFNHNVEDNLREWYRIEVTKK